MYKLISLFVTKFWFSKQIPIHVNQTENNNYFTCIFPMFILVYLGSI